MTNIGPEILMFSSLVQELSVLTKERVNKVLYMSGFIDPQNFLATGYSNPHQEQLHALRCSTLKDWVWQPYCKGHSHYSF